MAISKRQKIVNNIESKLKEITKDVFKWRVEGIELTCTPCIEWRDENDTPEDIAFQLTQHTLIVEIKVFAKGKDADAEIRALLAQVEQKFSIDLNLDGLAEDVLINPVPSDIDVEHKNKKIFSGLFSISVLYTTNRFDPYT